MVNYDEADADGVVTVMLGLALEFGGERVQVLGDWNDWSSDASPMQRTDEGYVATIKLARGRSYRFRYLVDGEHWKNDTDADDYQPNGFGGYDSVIDLTNHVDP